MDWVFFALLAPMLWAVVNIIDKYFLTKRIKSPYSYLILIAFSNMLILPLFPIISEINFLYPWSILAVILGIVNFLGFIFYNKAMQIEEPSRISMMGNLTPIIVLFMAFFFLDETLGNVQYIGSVLIIIGALLASYKKVRNKFSITPALIFIVLFALNMAAFQILTKYFLAKIDYYSFNFWTAIGVFLTGFLLLIPKGIRKGLMKEPYKFDRKFWFWRLVGTYIYFTGVIMFYIAVDTGFVSLASVFLSTQSLFILLYAYVLGIFLPGAIKEDLERRSVMLKLTSALLIVLGAYLIII